jgi:putative pyrroloquinoline-quinone binding quinoprotein
MDNARTGNDTTEGTVVSATAAWTATTTGGSTTLDGQVYASPLVYGTSVYVATENNTIYAFNTADGKEQWSVHMGAPEDASLLPCGNITPSVGVTGTPVIDPNAAGGDGMLFMVGMTSEPHYRLWGVDLVTHAVPIATIVDTGDIMVQGQRGALALSGGNIYIPYGGRAGDCYDPATNPPTPYYGIVERALESNGVAQNSWHAAGTQAAGIWAPGGESVDASGNVYAATGNGSGPGTESVFKLSPTLTVVNQWTAYNQAALDSGDQDVGSIAPGLVGGGDVFQNGKFGHGFLLDSALTQLTPDPGLVDCGGLTSDASFGATAYASPYIYVPCANGLYAVQQAGSSISVAWHVLSGFVGAPIVAGGLVWTMSNGNLYGFNATTGAPVVNVGIGSHSRFESPATGGGLIFVPGSDNLQAFSLKSGCSSATLSAAPPATQNVGSPVGFTATATGPGCSSPTFEYWVQYPSGTWVMTRPFNTTATWNWVTTGYPTGNYTIHVWANQAGNPTTTWEAFATLSYTLTGCTGAGLSAVPGSPRPIGTQVQFTATSSGCPNPQYEFWLQNPSGMWVRKQTFSGNAVWNWDTTGGYPAGTYTVHVWANQAGGDMTTWQAFGTASYTLTVPAHCATASLSPTNPSAAAGSMVALTASSTGCANPQYEFWVQYLDGSWHMLQGFSANATFNFTTTGFAPGVYTVHVWANQFGDPMATWEAYGSDTVTLTGCSSASLAPVNPSAAAGTTVNLTASSGGCASPRYEFWVQYLDGSWHMLQTFGGSTFGWTTTGRAPGIYTVHVWANQSGADMSTWEAYGSDTVTLTGCTSASIAPPSGSTTVGTKVTFTASSVGCPSPIYEFWLQDPGGTWYQMQGFVPGGATWQWNSAGWPKGNYVIHVWANNSGADTTTWETYGTATYTLT